MSVSTNPIAVGWLNENSLREYPFHEGCGLRPNDSAGTLVDGGWTLPNCLLVDMSASMSTSQYDPFLYLGRMSVVDGTVTMVFFGRGEGSMTLFVDSASHVKNGSYRASGTGSLQGVSCVATVGDLDAFLEATPEGAYSFSPEEALVEPTCVRPSATTVSSITAEDLSGYVSSAITGDINLIAGENIRLDYDPSDNAILISADPNSGYVEKCSCDDTNQSIVRSINGISVEDVDIVGDDCVQVTTDNGVVKISDTCAKPCCGCAETAFINQTINDLQTSVATLSSNVSSLGDRLSTFITSYALSRKTLQ